MIGPTKPYGSSLPLRYLSCLGLSLPFTSSKPSFSNLTEETTYYGIYFSVLQPPTYFYSCSVAGWANKSLEFYDGSCIAISGFFWGPRVGPLLRLFLYLLFLGTLCGSTCFSLDFDVAGWTPSQDNFCCLVSESKPQLLASNISLYYYYFFAPVATKNN